MQCSCDSMVPTIMFTHIRKSAFDTYFPISNFMWTHFHHMSVQHCVLKTIKQELSSRNKPIPNEYCELSQLTTLDQRRGYTGAADTGNTGHGQTHNICHSAARPHRIIVHGEHSPVLYLLRNIYYLLLSSRLESVHWPVYKKFQISVKPKPN